MKKTWKLINDLSSRNSCKAKKISEVIVEEQSITSPTEMSEAFNNYFASVGKNLADEIPRLRMNQKSILTQLIKGFL